MSILNDMIGKLGSMLGKAPTENAAQGDHQALHGGIMELLSGGGLNELVQSFKDKGLGEVISSWISTGENLPIKADQIKDVLGSEKISALASKAGVSTDDISSKLSKTLPGIIDKLTPEGSIPEGSLLDKGLDFLKSKLG